MRAAMGKAFKSARFIILLGIANRVLTLIKEILIASRIGCCFKTDAYFTAFVAVTLLAEIISEGISTGLIPILVKIEEREGRSQKIDYVNNIFHIAVFSAIILMIMGWLLSPFIIKILAMGFDADEIHLTINLMKIGLTLIMLIILRGIFVAFLQSIHGFKAGAKSWIYNSIIYLIFLLFFDGYGIYGLMITGIIASAVQLFSIVLATKDYGYEYRRIFNLKDIHTRELGILFMPIVIGISLNRINMVVDKSIASTLSAGSISWLNYANDIIQLILGIFITAIITVLFPIISQEFTRGNIESLRLAMLRGTKIIFSIVIPAMVILIVLSEPIVKLLFQRGMFGEIATEMTSAALTYYALGLGSMALVLILTKAHYATNDTLTPMLAATVGVVINIIFSITLSKYMGVRGIALATSISATFTSIILILDLDTRIKNIKSRRDRKEFFKIILAAIILLTALLLVYNTMIYTFHLGELISLLTAIIIGISIYTGALLRLFRI